MKLTTETYKIKNDLFCLVDSKTENCLETKMDNYINSQQFFRDLGGHEKLVVGTEVSVLTSINPGRTIKKVRIFSRGWI